jgi:serine/threonine protein kinase
MSENTPIEQVVDMFDEAWHRGDRPSVGKFLERVPERSHEEFLNLLLPIEIEYRSNAGEEVKTSDYDELGSTAQSIVARLISTPRTIEDQLIPSKQSEDANELVSQDSRQIGPYRLVEQIGEGGMGSVWLAEQERPVRRQVALKLIKPSLASKEVIARFEAERQALAMMDHPNIAKVFDAGTTETGSPFFVMELIDGTPLNVYCDDHKLSIRARLKIMIDVCGAIQHAHQKGILHRDLKPSNVLVGEANGKSVPKVIDFGLAKATEHATRLTDKTMFTEFGQVVGTLQYMSPEQAAMDSMDIDTRTDIYSLGVMLYELLAGSPPLDQESMGKKALLHVLEMIREKEPPRPSTRLSSAKHRSEDISRLRKIAPSKLQSILKGELDWIVMKAIEKDRKRRYETATGFADDMQRFLGNEAVVARPPSSWYRIQKFTQKNRVVACSLLGVALILFGAVAVSSWFAVASNKARVSAEASENAAISEANNNLQMLEIMTGSFISTSPEKGATSGTTVTDILLNATLKVEAADLPDTSKADLLQAIGYAFYGNGAYDEAIGVQRTCLTTRQKLLGDSDKDTVIAVANLANSLRAAGQNSDALKLNIKAYDSCMLVFGPQHARTISTLSNLAICYGACGQYKEALEAEKKAVGLNEQFVGAEHPQTLTSMANLALSCAEFGKLETAMKLNIKVLGLRKKVLGERHPHTLTSMLNLANSYFKDGEMDKAVELASKTLHLQRDVLGDDHPETLSTQQSLSFMHAQNGQHAYAIRLAQNVLQSRKRVQGDDHPDSLMAMQNIANIFNQASRHSDALNICEKLCSLRGKVLGIEHPDTLSSMGNLGISYGKVGRWNDAVVQLEETYSRMSKALGDSDSDISLLIEYLAYSYDMLGDQQLRSGKIIKSLESYVRSQKYYQKVVDENPSNVQAKRKLMLTYESLGDANLKLQNFSNAIESFKNGLAACKELVSLSPANARLQQNLWAFNSNLGTALSEQGDYSRAAKSFGEAAVVLRAMAESGLNGQEANANLKSLEKKIRQAKANAIALGEWNLLLKQPKNELAEYLNIRCVEFSQKGDTEKATRAAAELSKLEHPSAKQLYNAACVFALAAASIGQSIETGKLTNQKKEWIAQAMSCLKRSVGAGWEDFDYMDADPDLSILRDLPEFRILGKDQ